MLLHYGELAFTPSVTLNRTCVVTHMGKYQNHVTLHKMQVWQNYGEQATDIECIGKQEHDCSVFHARSTLMHTGRR